MNFEVISDYAEKINEMLNGIVWGFPTVALILITGVVFTVGTGFFQVRKIKSWLGETVGSLTPGRKSTGASSQKTNQLSGFQAACSALAATIGTGNITGVATAIAIGGPGAVFWMWFSAFFGMMTAYAENVLGAHFRCKNEYGEWCGGPMYYISEGIKHNKTAKILAALFSVFCICASFGIGNMTQINSITSAMNANFGTDMLLTGIIVSVLAAIVIVGGVSRLGKVTEKLVPVMSLFYIGSCVIIILSNAGQIPYILKSVISGAFSMQAVAGAGSGLIIKRAVSCGIRRGIFSNEAGLGSSVIVNSASDVKSPVHQGMWGIFEVFFDTFVLCSMTAFVLLSAECDAVSLEQALNNLSEETQYVAICDTDKYYNSNSIPLMDISLDPVFEISAPYDRKSKVYTVYPQKGEPFDVFLKRTESAGGENVIHTNIMAIRGICINPDTGAVDSGGKINAVSLERVEGVQLVTYAFSRKFGSWSGKILAVAILFFAFSTLIGWSYYGTKAWEYLFGAKYTSAYKCLFVLFILPGAVLGLDLIWEISDTLNGLMALPNLAGVLALSGKVFEITHNHFPTKKYALK